MRVLIMTALVSWAAVAHAAVVHVPIKSDLSLKPGEAFTITVDAHAPTEIGWQTAQAKPCTSSCVQATETTGGVTYSIATARGASKKYTPTSGRISIEYKNVSSASVTINVYRVDRTCEAEACMLLDERQKSRWLVFKVDEFTAITTSKDESYSLISGVTTSGRPFNVRAVWWTDDKRAAAVNCGTFVKRYVNNHTPKQIYRPYVISGQAIGEGEHVVLRSVDACVPKAVHFGVPDKNVFD
jgi:hypothetical protein